MLDSKRAVQKKKQPNILGTEKRDWLLGANVRVTGYLVIQVTPLAQRKGSFFGKHSTHTNFWKHNSAIEHTSCYPFWNALKTAAVGQIVQGTPAPLQTRRSRRICTRTRLVVFLSANPQAEKCTLPKRDALEGAISQNRKKDVASRR